MGKFTEAVAYPYRVLRTGRLFVPTLLAAALPFVLVELLVFAAESRVAPYRDVLTAGLFVLALSYYVGIQVRVYRSVLAREGSSVRLSDRGAIRADALRVFPLVVVGFAVPVYAGAAAGLDPVAMLSALWAGDWTAVLPVESRDPLLVVGVVTAVAGSYLLPAAQGGIAEDARLNRRFVGRRLLPVLRTLPYAGFWLLSSSLAVAGVLLVTALLSALSSVVPSGNADLVVPVLVLLGVVAATYFVTAASAVAARGYARARDRVVSGDSTGETTIWGE